ncbi:MAG: penicillin-binding protein 2 [Burkholderiaceae bacterium]|nr:penicillin-binding protein 2 [Burkholderiaceae bacterium]
MTEIRNPEIELQQFRLRALIAAIMVVLVFSGLMVRFFWLQVFQHEKYAAAAEENRISILPIPPDRGIITDRKGVVLARNYSAYTLELTPSKIKDLETTVDALSALVEITPKDRKRFKKLLEDSRRFESVPIRSRLSDEEVARFIANRFRFPGVEVQAKLFRQYPMAESASHVIGYIGRISQKDAEIIEQREDAANYIGTKYIGKEGIEKRYQQELLGTTGFEEVEVSAAGRAIRTLSRTPAQAGKNLILSIDIELQKRIENWYGQRRGAFVAIEPATGDVLAFVSKPGYDPNLFVDGIDLENWKELNESPDKPLINRPLTGLYPPGSTYKPFMALAALETGKRTAEQAIYDPGHFYFGNHKFRDDKAGGHGMVDMYKSIVQSCDTYYYLLANEMGVDMIHDFMKPFGFGQLTGIDLEGEKRGLLPSQQWKRQAFKKPEQKKWIPGETISLGIGQGYNAFTILQLAHATATLANNGVVMKPHLVKAIEDPRTGKRELTVRGESYRIALKQENLEVIKRGLIGVNKEGTSARAFLGAEYVAAGKTGTSQLFQIKQGETYNAARVHERLRDHALYMAFAPADNPRIAIAMIVENGGFGAAAAAPIARKAFDYYLLGKLPSGEEKEDEKIETEQDNSLPAEPNPFEMRPEGEQTTRPEISNLSKVARTNSQPRVKAAASSIQKALTQRLKSTRLATSRNKNA